MTAMIQGLQHEKHERGWYFTCSSSFLFTHKWRALLPSISSNWLSSWYWWQKNVLNNRLQTIAVNELFPLSSASHTQHELRNKACRLLSLIKKQRLFHWASLTFRYGRLIKFTFLFTHLWRSFTPSPQEQREEEGNYFNWVVWGLMCSLDLPDMQHLPTDWTILGFLSTAESTITRTVRI